MKTAVRMAILALAVAHSLAAQKPRPIELGFQPERVYDFTGIDNVNVFNGNNVVTIPLGLRYPLTAGFSYGLTLVYNSKVWDHRRMEMATPPYEQYWWAKPNLRSNAGTGWRLSLGRLLPPSGATVAYPDDHRGNWVYEGPSGDEHAFTSHVYGAEPTSDPNATVQFTSDGSRLRMRRLTFASDTSRMVELPDGLMHTFDKEHNVWRLRRMEDRFGNYVTITYSYDSQNRVTQWTIADSKGRSHKVFFSYVSAMADTIDKGMNLDRIELQGLEIEDVTTGTRTPQTYTITFTRGTISTPYSCYHDYYNPPVSGAPAAGSNTTLPVLTQIDLPDGTSWSFAYQTTGEGCGSGLLREITLPTGGIVSYAYQLYTLTDGACVPTGPRNSTPGVATRTIDGHTTTYMLTRGPNVTPVHPGRPEPGNCGVLLDGPIPPNESRRWHRTSILSPPDAQNNRTRSDHYFNMWTAAGGDEDPDLEAHDGTYYALGEPITAGWPGFDRARLAPPEMESSPDVSAIDVGTLPSASNRSLGDQFWSGCSVDGSCSTLLRSTYRRLAAPELKQQRLTVSDRTLFHDDAGCNGLCFTQSDRDPASWDRVGHFRTSHTTSNFPGLTGDTRTTAYPTWTESALEDTLTPWVLERYSEKTREIGFDALRSTFCFDMNGRLTRQRLVAAVSEQSKDLLTQYTWDGGDVIAEGSFGGDGSNLGVQSDVCTATLGTAGYENQYTWANGVLATSRYPEPIPFLSLDYTSDPTGIVTASRATDGLATEYQYEPWGRLKSVKPPAETETVYAVTNATGTAGPKIVARRNPNPASTTDDVVLRWDYDKLGRISRLERTLPGAGCVEQKITWDALGRKSTESVWAACGSPSVAATHYHYDPLGRISRIVTPDGKESSVTWTGARLARRTADVGGFPTVTEEEYDMFGRLVGVIEDAGGSRPLTTRYTWDAGDRLTTATILGGSGDQQRTFFYDGRGLLTSEQHPELGSLGNGVTTYTYDSRGHVTRKITGSFDLTYDYDSAERLAEVRETGGRVLDAIRVRRLSLFRPHTPKREADGVGPLSLRRRTGRPVGRGRYAVLSLSRGQWKTWRALHRRR